MCIGRIAGIRFSVSGWLVALAALFAAAGLAVKLSLLFAAVLFHECAHAAAARYLGYAVEEVELLPFGGVARIRRLDEADGWDEIRVAAAGPAASLLAAGLCAAIQAQWGGTETLVFFREANWMLVWFNLLPALPLDGGRIWRAGLGMCLSYRRAAAVAAGTGRLAGAVLMGKVFYDGWYDQTLQISFLIAAVFLLAAADGESRGVSYRALRLLARKKAALAARGCLPVAPYTVTEKCPARDMLKLPGPEKYCVLLVVDDAGRICATMTETEVWEGLGRCRPDVTMGELAARRRH